MVTEGTNCEKGNRESDGDRGRLQEKDINRASLRKVLPSGESVIKIEFPNMEEGRSLWVTVAPSGLLRYLCQLRTARRSHCRYTIEICSCDVSGNSNSGAALAFLSSCIELLSQACEHLAHAKDPWRRGRCASSGKRTKIGERERKENRERYTHRGSD